MEEALQSCLSDCKITFMAVATRVILFFHLEMGLISNAWLEPAFCTNMQHKRQWLAKAGVPPPAPPCPNSCWQCSGRASLGKEWGHSILGRAQKAQSWGMAKQCRRHRGDPQWLPRTHRKYSDLSPENVAGVIRAILLLSSILGVRGRRGESREGTLAARRALGACPTAPSPGWGLPHPIPSPQLLAKLKR